MLPEERLYLNQKVALRGHKGVFAIVVCLEGLIGHDDAILRKRCRVDLICVYHRHAIAAKCASYPQYRINQAHAI